MGVVQLTWGEAAEAAHNMPASIAANEAMHRMTRLPEEVVQLSRPQIVEVLQPLRVGVHEDAEKGLQLRPRDGA
jgi:hypothetical protein